MYCEWYMQFVKKPKKTNKPTLSKPQGLTEEFMR